ncbi:MAG: TlpA family protein disulfide reductase [Acidobacteriota bacterium]
MAAVLLAAGVACLGPGAGPPAGAAPGRKPETAPASRLELIPASGAEVLRLVRQADGEVTLLNIWATWCLPCKKEMPDILRFRQAYKGRGLRVILVSADFDTERAGVLQFLEALGVDFPTYIKTGGDMEFINALDPAWTGVLPASFLFDAQGKRRDFWEGAIDSAGLEQKVQALIEDKETVK